MHDVIRIKKLGVYATCVNPLEDELMQPTQATAYQYALDRLIQSRRMVRIYRDQPLPVGDEISSQFAMNPENAEYVVQRAWADIEDIDTL